MRAPTSPLTPTDPGLAVDRLLAKQAPRNCGYPRMASRLFQSKFKRSSEASSQSLFRNKCTGVLGESFLPLIVDFTDRQSVCWAADE
jgi:hypothetical protein